MQASYAATQTACWSELENLQVTDYVAGRVTDCDMTRVWLSDSRTWHPCDSSCTLYGAHTLKISPDEAIMEQEMYP